MSIAYESLYQMWKRKERERLERERWLSNPELAEAMRRFPLVSPESALKAHRNNPRGGTS